jgi:Lamin Tail Domain
MRRHYVFCAAALSASALFGLSNVGSAAVIISEFMYEAAGSDNDREWVEIYNTGDTTVDLEGWRIHDEDAGSQPGSLIPAGTALAPKQALVLIETQSVFDEHWGTGINTLVYPGMGTTLNMANTGTDEGDEVLQLRDADGNLVDAVDYMNSSPFPSVTNGTATTIYVLPSFLNADANDLGASWARSTAGVHGAYQNLHPDHGIEAGSPGTVVPEPASALLVAAAAVGLLIVGRRRAA